jgi:hypothetical protein
MVRIFQKFKINFLYIERDGYKLWENLLQIYVLLLLNLESLYSLIQTALTSHVYAKQIFWRKKRGAVTSEEIIKELVATS